MRSSLRSRFAAAFAVLGIALVGATQATQGTDASPGRSTAGPLPAVQSFAPVAYAGTVYLTFDDGPSATYTPEVLAILRKDGVKAVFFEIGQNVSSYPSITRSLRYYGMK